MQCSNPSNMRVTKEADSQVGRTSRIVGSPLGAYFEPSSHRADRLRGSENRRSLSLGGRDWGQFVRQWACAIGSVDLDGPQMQELVTALVENVLEVNPTLVLLEALYWGDDSTNLSRFEPETRRAGVSEKG